MANPVITQLIEEQILKKRASYLDIAKYESTGHINRDLAKSILDSLPAPVRRRVLQPMIDEVISNMARQLVAIAKEEGRLRPRRRW